MAEPKKAAPKASAGKSKVKGFQIGKLYSSGKAINKSCPKCGSGTFMAEHKDRRTCGKCNYMEKK